MYLHPTASSLSLSISFFSSSLFLPLISLFPLYKLVVFICQKSANMTTAKVQSHWSLANGRNRNSKCTINGMNSEIIIPRPSASVRPIDLMAVLYSLCFGGWLDGFGYVLTYGEKGDETTVVPHHEEWRLNVNSHFFCFL